MHLSVTAFGPACAHDGRRPRVGGFLRDARVPRALVRLSRAAGLRGQRRAPAGLHAGRIVMRAAGLKADLHVHTREAEPSIAYGAHDAIDRAAREGFRVLGITNHDTVTYDDELVAYARGRGVLLIPGIEATVEGRHVLVYNADVAANKLRTFADLRRYRTPDWLVVAPHPVFPTSYCLRERRPPAGARRRPRARAAAPETQPPASGSPGQPSLGFGQVLKDREARIGVRRQRAPPPQLGQTRVRAPKPAGRFL